jgi:hypothetical protein
MRSAAVLAFPCTICHRSAQNVHLAQEDGMADGGTRFNMQLDEHRASKLRALAERTHVNPGRLARSLLSMALDEVDPDPSSIVAVLDSIPGAIERANQGLREIRAGEGAPLDEF